MPDKGHNFWKLGCISGGVGILIILSAVSLALFRVGYLDFTYYLLAQVDALEKLAQFRQNYLSLIRFSQLRFLSLLLIILWIGLWIILYRNINPIVHHLQQIQKDFNDLLKKAFHLSSKQWLGFLSLLLGISIIKLYLLFQIPILEDEAFTYVFFVAKGLGVSLSYYPGPNNHVFLSVLGSLFNPLFSYAIEEPIFTLRFISWLASLGLMILLFFWLNTWLNYQDAFFLTLLFQLVPSLLLYSILARGYSLQLLFFMTSAIALIQQFQRPQIIYRYIFIGSSLLGFYTIPTFVYPMLSFGIYGIYKIIKARDFKRGRIFILDMLIIGLGITFLYTPIILTQGTGAILQNSWVKPLSMPQFFQSFPNYLIQSSNFLVEDYWALFWIISGVFTCLSLLYKNTQAPNLSSLELEIKYLSISLLLLPIPIMVLQKILAFARVWLYLIFPTFLLGILIFRWLIPYSNLRIILLSITLCSFSYLSTKLFSQQSPSSYHIFTEQIAQDSSKHIFVNDNTYQVFLKYYYLKHENKGQISNKDYASQISYDWVILNKKQAYPPTFTSKFYKIYIENEEVIGFQRIKF